ncbi:MAG: PIN domain-containing protein, partial [Pseudomonadota bacterium]
MAFLLDSNIVSNLIRDPYGGIGQRIDAVGSANVLTSILVTSEIQYGLSKSGSGRLRANFERILHGLAVASFEPPADRVYGELRAALHKKGTPIGELDTLI